MIQTPEAHHAPHIDLSCHAITGREQFVAGVHHLLEEARKVALPLPTVGPVVSIADLEEMVALVMGGE